MAWPRKAGAFVAELAGDGVFAVADSVLQQRLQQFGQLLRRGPAGSHRLPSRRSGHRVCTSPLAVIESLLDRPTSAQTPIWPARNSLRLGMFALQSRTSQLGWTSPTIGG